MKIQSVRFAESTWQLVQEAACLSGISASQFIREATIARLAIDITRAKPERGETYQALMEEVRRISLGEFAVGGPEDQDGHEPA